MKGEMTAGIDSQEPHCRKKRMSHTEGRKKREGRSVEIVWRDAMLVSLVSLHLFRLKAH